jgi:peptidoglycan/xylan/chitin deacetylase (PgdA/CDA1 family)
MPHELHKTGFAFVRMCFNCALMMLVVLGAAILVACAAPDSSTTTPTPVVQIVQVVATPVALPSATPSAAIKSTAPAIPTPFVTAPAPGGEASIPILMYHHIGDLPIDATELQTTWTVTPKNFDAQMQWLARSGFRSITMAQLVAHLKNRQPLPAKPIIISFDDGWEEQFSTAFPIMTRYGLSATFFVYTQPLDHTQYMTWAQVQALATGGMDIQSHSITHPHLRTMAPDAAFKEIADSKATLEKRLGKPVVAFCYPFGEYNNAIVEMVKRAGYESAVTLASGYRQRADELYTLHRIRVSYHDTLDDFVKRLP